MSSQSRKATAASKVRAASTPGAKRAVPAAAIEVGGPDCAKRCPNCGAVFSLQELIALPTLAAIGMVDIPGRPASAIYWFTHLRRSCKTTFVLPVEVFRTEISEPIPPANLNGDSSCAGHCSRIEDLEVCDEECCNAPYRRFLLQRLVPRK